MKEILNEWRKFLKEQEEKQKSIFVLVGPPSVGKSTWIENTFEEEPYIINRDDLVEQVAEEYGWTYDDMFASPPQDANVGDVDEKYGTVAESPSWMTWQNTVFDKVLEANNKIQQLFTTRVSEAVPSGQDIVVDMTNMNAASRKNALKAIEGNEPDYKKVAVVFEFEGAEEAIQAVAQKRAEAAQRMGKSKTIPPAAFGRMFGAYQQVDPSEGFDDVVSVDNREKLKDLASQKNKEPEQEEPEDDLDERCQKGYKTHPTRKTKKMYGKTYRNCVKAEE
jgi:predicted kinase